MGDVRLEEVCNVNPVKCYRCQSSLTSYCKIVEYHSCNLYCTIYKKNSVNISLITKWKVFFWKHIDTYVHFALKAEQTIQLCDKLLQMYPDAAGQATLIKALCMAREGQTKEAVSLLKEFAKKNPKSVLEMKLAAVQLLLSEVWYYLTQLLVLFLTIMIWHFILLTS